MGGRGGRFRKPSSHRLADALALISTAALLAAPTPSVSLDTMLAPPPGSGYVAGISPDGAPIGAFGPAAYASYVAAADSTLANTLSQDGFAGGFGASWREQTSGHDLVELVVAFAGGAGARNWLTTAQRIARASDHYRRAIVVFGIGQYYGVHNANPGAPSYSDVVSFVKGNNFFTVGFTSGADDLALLAAAQARRQSDFAPNDSIPPAQWPENLHRLTGGIDALKVAVIVAAGGVLFALRFSVAVFFYVRREESGAADAKLSLDGKRQPPDG